MSEQLNKLLKKYDKGELNSAERQQLRELAETEAGKSFILASNTPEAVFLADDDSPLPDWSSREAELEASICSHQQYSANKNILTSKRFLALAATLVIAVLVSLTMLPSSPSSEQETTAPSQLIYTLKHRMPQEIIPHIRNFMSDETDFFVDSEKGTIEIKDTPENIANLERIITLLDREPLNLEFDLKLLSPNSPDVNVIRQAGGVPSEELNLENYSILDGVNISAMEGRQFRQVISDRYDVVCFVSINPEATEANIVTMSIYDLQEKKMIFRGRDIPLSKGWTKIEETGLVNQENVKLVVAISLNDIN